MLGITEFCLLLYDSDEGLCPNIQSIDLNFAKHPGFEVMKFSKIFEM